MTLSRRTILAASALAVLAAGAFLLARWAAPEPTDEERIRTLFAEAARAAQEKRVGDVMDALSERFRGEGLDRAGVKQLVALHAFRGEWNRVAITADRIAVDGDAATAVLHVLLARSGAGESLASVLPAAGSAYRIACTLAREDEGWRVVTAAWRPMPLDEALAEPSPPEGAPGTNRVR